MTIMILLSCLLMLITANSRGRKGNNETRYKYLYSEEELDELAGKIKKASSETGLMFAQFNNHWQGYAPRNATDLKKQMGLPFVQLPLLTDALDEGKQQPLI